MPTPNTYTNLSIIQGRSTDSRLIDRPSRDKALSSLQSYLKSGRAFTELELLKLWKGLFFCMYHTANPLPQQQLVISLSSLLLALPRELFLPFFRAFYTTLTVSYSSIDSHRLNKYLLLIRQYVSSAFIYLRAQSWDTILVAGYLDLIEGKGGLLNASDDKVPDGLRYHVLDVWIDGLEGIMDEESGWHAPLQKFLLPVEGLVLQGRTKVLRRRAKEVLSDPRLRRWLEERSGVYGCTSRQDGEALEAEEWEGIAD